MWIGMGMGVGMGMGMGMGTGIILLHWVIGIVETKLRYKGK